MSLVSELDDESCYRAVQARDVRFDGRFFTGVRSTGIYCRPICPARLPGRAQCVFFACSAAAQDAGYRACRRCRPESAPGTPAWKGSSTTVARAFSLISRGALDGTGNLDQLSSSLGVSARHLRRLFADHLGTSPISVAQARRIEFARSLVDHSVLPMTLIANAAGFSSVRRFNASFKAAFGCSARDVRTRQKIGRGRPADVILRLAYRQPYCWPSLLRFFAARAIPGVECVHAGHYLRSVRIGETSGCISVTQAEERSELRLQIPSCLVEHSLHIAETVRSLFDLRADPTAFASHFHEHEPMAALVRRYPGVRVPGSYQLFELAVRALLGQHISVKAATTLSGRLVARYGEPLAAPGRLAGETGPTHIFPTAERLARARAEAIGLPGARAAALRELSRAFVDQRVDVGGSIEELQASLLRIRGIGPWTAGYIAMRSGGEPDAFPAGDLILLRSASRLLGKTLTTRQLGEEARAWAPWRAYAAILLWRHHAENPSSCA